AGELPPLVTLPREVTVRGDDVAFGHVLAGKVGLAAHGLAGLGMGLLDCGQNTRPAADGNAHPVDRAALHAQRGLLRGLHRATSPAGASSGRSRIRASAAKLSSTWPRSFLPCLSRSSMRGDKATARSTCSLDPAR